MEKFDGLTVPRMFSDADGQCRFDRIGGASDDQGVCPTQRAVAVSSPMTVRSVIGRKPRRRRDELDDEFAARADCGGHVAHCAL